MSEPIAAKWEDIPSEPVRPGIRRRGFGTSDMLLVMNEVEPGAEINPHSHDDFDQIALIISGHARYHVGGVAHEVGPGSVLLIPAGTTHHIEPLGEETVHNLDAFGPARGDYLHLLEWMRTRADKGDDQ